LVERALVERNVRVTKGRGETAPGLILIGQWRQSTKAGLSEI